MVTVGLYKNVCDWGPGTTYKRSQLPPAVCNFFCHILAPKFDFKFVFGAYLKKYRSYRGNFCRKIYYQIEYLIISLDLCFNLQMWFQVVKCNNIISLYFWYSFDVFGVYFKKYRLVKVHLHSSRRHTVANIFHIWCPRQMPWTECSWQFL